MRTAPAWDEWLRVVDHARLLCGCWQCKPSPPVLEQVPGPLLELIREADLDKPTRALRDLQRAAATQADPADQPTLELRPQGCLAGRLVAEIFKWGLAGGPPRSGAKAEAST